MLNKRLIEIDVIRGFAITGILFVNVLSFSWPTLYDSFPSLFWTSSWDQFIQWALYIFIQSNFYPLFALLFGLGIGLMYKSVLKKGLNPTEIFLRRFLFLFVIGFFHAFFLWYGDILMIYAILGIFILPFLKARKHTLFLFGLFFYLIPNLIYSGYLFLMEFHISSDIESLVVHSVISNYSSGYSSILLQNVSDWILNYPLNSLPFLVISIFPLFLFGLALSRSQWLYLSFQWNRSILTVWLLSGFIGLSLKSLPLFDSTYLFYIHISEAFGGPLLGVFYGLSVIRLVSAYKRLAGIFGPLGRMSMTNYLGQTLLGFFLFKVFGLYGRVSPTYSSIIAIGIITLQMVFSRYWLSKHPFGPMEKIWRCVTYGKLIWPKRFSKSPPK